MPVMLIEYQYVVPKFRSVIEGNLTVPEKGDAVLVKGADDGPIYKGTIQAVAEPVFADVAETVTYLLYIDVPTDQPKIQALAEFVESGENIALMMAPVAP